VQGQGPLFAKKSAALESVRPLPNKAEALRLADAGFFPPLDARASLQPFAATAAETRHLDGRASSDYLVEIGRIRTMTSISSNLAQ
jgi:hypothetical protein